MAAVVKVDYPVEIYLDRLHELRTTLVYASAIGAIGTLILGLLFARRLTRPIRALTAGVTRVAGGDLSEALPVRSADELGRLTRAFNQMLDGLRQRDFIRSAFGRYVSPEVARELLESPDGLRFGGEKRVVTVLMSDLRGYTRFAEQGDPAHVMNVLNEYLARMTDVVIKHGGTVNEFIGDAVFAVFGAPLAHADHAERAAACALSMQAAMADINRQHAASGLPRFEMGIGVNTGEAVVGNIGSEQRAKYAVVGSAVNVAARVEGATVGGQVFITTATYEQIRELAEVAEPVAIQMKGLTEALLLYDLRGLGGRFAPPPAPPDHDLDARVSLPLRCWVIEGKIVGAARIDGRVLRIGPRELLARLDRPLPPLTNVKLRLDYPDGGGESADVYGKVTREEPDDAGPLTRIHFTSMNEADRKAVEALVAAPARAEEGVARILDPGRRAARRRPRDAPVTLSVDRRRPGARILGRRGERAELDAVGRAAAKSLPECPARRDSRGAACMPSGSSSCAESGERRRFASARHEAGRQLRLRGRRPAHTARPRPMLRRQRARRPAARCRRGLTARALRCT